MSKQVRVKRRRPRDYSDETLRLALEAVRSGRSTSEVSRSFQIPKPTLIAIRKGRRSGTNKPGPSKILSTEEESVLLTWINFLNKRGFRVTKTLFLMSVGSLVKKLQRTTPFKDGIPGKSWYNGFCHRHPDISFTQNSMQSRATVTETALKNWFSEVQDQLDEKSLTDIDKSRVYNCNESAFFMAPKEKRVLVPRGDKNYTFNGDKGFLTALFMTNAKGDLPPPMVVFPYERLPACISAAFPNNWSIGKTTSGWMDAETFYEYISNVFEPWLTKNNIERPVVLYIDAHSSYVTLPLFDFCIEHRIELIALYPNSTHITQPCDKALFAELEKKWREKLNISKSEKQRKLRREEFGSLLKIAVDDLDLPKLMSDGFRACGLHPFDPHALNYNELPRKQRGEVCSPKVEKVTDSEGRFEVRDLEIIESEIDPTLLQEFKHDNEQHGTWTGAMENQGLFQFWQKFANNCCKKPV